MSEPGNTPTPLRIGVDVGGTFTDLVAFDGEHLRVVKRSSTPPEFQRAVLDAVAEVRGSAVPAHIVHGSTVATNALLERKGEPIAFVTTEGFRDMLLIGRQNRPNLYALHVARPRPITQTVNTFTVRERIDATGKIIEPLTDDEIGRLIDAMRQRGLRHVAVCLLFSFINPEHERRIGRACERAGLIVSLSSELLPEFREFERASTTAINASLRPPVRAYLAELERGLGEDERTQKEQGVIPRLRIMHSAGGTLSVAEASAQAARLVLSGPAGGVIGAAFVARSAGFSDLITYDMGGTSTDVATILDGRPQWTTVTTVDGLPIGLPMFDIHTIGAGGGSVAYLDTGGALRVGPRSAGAVPGPACYERGGDEPTVTDANVLLGRILPDQFLGGAMRIEPTLAQRAIHRLAVAMNKTDIEAALGIVRIADANMTHALRAVTSRRGHDPRRFTLVSFGGAGGLHACALAEALEIPRVLIPPYAGVLSALGMVVAPQVVDLSRTIVHLRDRLDDALLGKLVEEISSSAAAQLADAGSAAVEMYADVRFVGQSHEVKVAFDRPRLDVIRANFIEAYRRLYGQAPEHRPIEIVTLRLRRIGSEPPVKLPPLDQGDPAPADRTTTLIDAEGQPRTAPVLTRSALRRAGRVAGPALLIDPESTTYIPPTWQATSDPIGNVLLTRG